MQCLKCGKPATAQQVFCDDCLAVMQNYPIKPGTVVQLPSRETHGMDKKQAPRHREPTPAEQLSQLRRTIRWLLSMIALLSVLLLLTAGMLLHTLDKAAASNTIGRNYTTADSNTLP